MIEIIIEVVTFTHIVCDMALLFCSDSEKTIHDFFIVKQRSKCFSLFKRKFFGIVKYCKVTGTNA